MAVRSTAPAFAEGECDAACQAARNDRDPLAPVTANLTDNTIGFGPRDENETRDHQLQGAHSLEHEPGNLIPCGVLPFLGRPDDPEAEQDRGLGDTILQAFRVPDAAPGSFKIGFGPQVSLKTREDAFGGPGTGAGAAAVGFGFAGDLSHDGILGHLRGEDGFSATTIQPIVFCDMPDFLGGSYIGYNNPLACNWNADTGDEPWLAPIGLAPGETWPLGDGVAFDAGIGGYALAVAADRANLSQSNLSFNCVFPKARTRAPAISGGFSVTGARTTRTSVAAEGGPPAGAVAFPVPTGRVQG